MHILFCVATLFVYRPLMFGKWFASTYTGSMLGAGSDVFAVWSWVVANAGPKGELEINPALLAAMIGEPVERIEKAVEFLCAPDPKSRSTEEEGRRIVHEGAFSYRVVNHAKYRAARSEEARRAQNREAKRRQRERSKSADSQQESASVSNVSRGQPKTEDRRQKTEADSSLSRPSATTRGNEQVLSPEMAQAVELAQYLFDSIRGHTPEFEARKTPAQLEKKLMGWASDIEKLLRIDGKSPEHIRAVIDKCHNDPTDDFEHGNVQSGAKLRKRWNQLWAKAKSRVAASPADSLENFDFQAAGQFWESL